MNKKSGLIKLNIYSGKANPSPPIGSSLGQKGLNIMEFCKKFNEYTKNINNVLLSVKIYFYSDKSYTFLCKKPSISYLIKNLLKIDKIIPSKNKICIKYTDILNLAEYKIYDFNTNNFYSILKTIIANINSMGIIILYI